MSNVLGEVKKSYIISVALGAFLFLSWACGDVIYQVCLDDQDCREELRCIQGSCVTPPDEKAGDAGDRVIRDSPKQPEHSLAETSFESTPETKFSDQPLQRAGAIQSSLSF